MKMTAREACAVAKAWKEAQDDLPKASIAMPRAYKYAVQGRLFTVMLHVPKLQKSLNVMEFYVYDTGEVQVSKDRRTAVKKILEKLAVDVEALVAYQPNRRSSLARFIEIMQPPVSDAPEWYRGTQFVTNAASESIADGYARIFAETTEIGVPVKIFASSGMKARFFRNHSVGDAERTVGLVIFPEKGSDTVREEYFHNLSEILVNRRYG